MSNRGKIKKLAVEMMTQSHESMVKAIDKALDCGALDIESWDENDMPMVIPKVIVKAVLESEANRYSARGTNVSFERKVNKEVKNLKYFL